jgi:O-acetyl-ADP-ribose deacetylase (regulator of RNase III)
VLHLLYYLKEVSRSPPSENEYVAIEYISGNLFENRVGAEAFGHGCNLQGSMGAGIAKSFKERYPQMYEEYRRRCKAQPRQFNLGDSFLWKEEGKPWVFNLGTQENYWRTRASYEAIEASLEKMKRQADEEGIRTVAIPQIGTGYGRLSWKKVRTIIERIFDDWSGMLYVYEKYVPGNTGKINRVIPS